MHTFGLNSPTASDTEIHSKIHGFVGGNKIEKESTPKQVTLPYFKKYYYRYIPFPRFEII